MEEHRRASDTQFTEIKAILVAQNQKLDDIETKVDNHVKTFDEEYKPALKEYMKIAQTGKGLAWLARGLIYIGAPVGTAIWWFKDHIKP